MVQVCVGANNVMGGLPHPNVSSAAIVFVGVVESAVACADAAEVRSSAGSGDPVDSRPPSHHNRCRGDAFPPCWSAG